jgi:hypothetical protein
MTLYELSMEEKAIILMSRQSLKLALKECTFRWLFCWDGESTDSGFDCACCIGWEEEIEHRCGCVCHKRFKELEALFSVALRSKEKHNQSWWWDRNINGVVREKKE